jgi:hypothetical protein
MLHRRVEIEKQHFRKESSGQDIGSGDRNKVFFLSWSNLLSTSRHGRPVWGCAFHCIPICLPIFVKLILGENTARFFAAFASFDYGQDRFFRMTEGENRLN